MGSALSEKDANAPVQTQDAAAANNGKPTGVKSLEYHRQMLQSKMAEEKYGAKNTNKSTGITSTDVAPANAKNPKSHLLANVDGPDGRTQQYISPSDNIMSPCTAKLSALKGRAAARAKPKSLFAQSSAKKFEGSDVFGSKKAPKFPSPEYFRAKDNSQPQDGAQPKDDSHPEDDSQPST
ncbi:hypothetical protein F4804DRAFT_302080 [Jackrogersella minutella]|nr:hypothetical protein F4804DRAFT_302080 [Jackrogersella minutella]